MFTDPLLLKYLLMLLLAVWGLLFVSRRGKGFSGYLVGVLVFLVITYAALGTGFSIHIPYFHNKMEIVTYTTYDERVHALAHPFGEPGEPMHIVFSIDPDTKMGGQMRKTFFDAVRAREGKRHQSNIIIDMKGYKADIGVYKYAVAPALPEKQ